MRGGVYLSDKEWMVVEPFIPRQKGRKDGRGRPRKDPREVLDAIIWILISGSPWHLLPKDYPPYQTCHRYFQLWVRKGVIQKVLKALGERHQGKTKSSEVMFVDATFAAAKKGATR